MSKIKLLLISGQGQIKETIIESFPAEFELTTFDLNDPIQHDLEEKLLTKPQTDICILNLSYTNGNSQDLFNKICQVINPTPILVLHHYRQKTFAQVFIDLGAHAYVPVNSYEDEILDAIREIQDGQTYISQSVNWITL